MEGHGLQDRTMACCRLQVPKNMMEAEGRFKVERLSTQSIDDFPSYLPSSYLVDNAPANKKASERFP